MIYVETAAAAEIFNIHLDTLKKSAGRNSKKYPFVRIEGAGARSRGGVKLLFAVEIAGINAAINSGKIDKDMGVYLPDSAQGCGYRAVKFSEISPADASALVDSKDVKAATNGTTEGVGSLNFTQGEEYGSRRDNNAAIANGLVNRRDRSRWASSARDTDASQGNEEVNAVYTAFNQKGETYENTDDSKGEQIFRQGQVFEADEISDNAHSATSAFVNALAIAWGTSPQKAAETVAFQLEFLRKKKKG